MTPFKAGETLVYDWESETDLLAEEPGLTPAHFTLLKPDGTTVIWQHTEDPITSDRKFEVPLPRRPHTRGTFTARRSDACARRWLPATALARPRPSPAARADG